MFSSQPARQRQRIWWREGLLGLCALMGICAGAPSDVAAQQALGGGDRFDRPARQPGIIDAALVDPDWGFQFGVAPHRYTVEVADIDQALDSGTAFAEGALMNADFLLGRLRLGYGLLVYRNDLPAGSRSAGKEVDFLGFEAQQLWVHYGMRPWRRLFAGLGLGWQSRLVRLLNEGQIVKEQTESSPLVAALLDYRVRGPFSFQLRVTRELGQGLIRADGASLHLMYYVPF